MCGKVWIEAARKRTSTQTVPVCPSVFPACSWRKLPALQQPEYPDRAAVDKVFGQIAQMPPLIFAGECRTLQERLAKASSGDAFVITGGDCAESFSQFSANRIRDFYRVLLQMSVVLAFGGGVPVVKLGRIAGQFAKPRSADNETIDGVTLPAYRGDIINGPEFTSEARVPNPERLVQAYNQSAATLNLLRGFSTGGYGGLARVSQWNLDFMQNSPEGKAYLDLAKRVDEAITFMTACGMDPASPLMRETEFYTSHEALLLDYEESLTRLDSTTGGWCVIQTFEVQDHDQDHVLACAHMHHLPWPYTSKIFSHKAECCLAACAFCVCAYVCQ